MDQLPSNRALHVPKKLYMKNFIFCEMVLASYFDLTHLFVDIDGYSEL